MVMGAGNPNRFHRYYHQLTWVSDDARKRGRPLSWVVILIHRSTLVSEVSDLDTGQKNALQTNFTRLHPKKFKQTKIETCDLVKTLLAGLEEKDFIQV